jgi:pyrophosphatase PpaX
LAPRDRLRAILFDWDGTLVDSAEASFRAYLQLFASYGIPFDRDRFATTYSPDWYRTYEAVALARDRWAEADARWLQLYTEEETHPVPGAAETLTRLREARLSTALVTSASRSRIARELSSLSLSNQFDLVVCCEDVGFKKPDPRPLRFALERLGIEPAAAAYLGDSPEDVIMSRGARVYAVGIEGGFPNRVALRAAKPDLLVADLPAAVDALLAPATRSSP